MAEVPALEKPQDENPFAHESAFDTFLQHRFRFPTEGIPFQRTGACLDVNCLIHQTTSPCRSVEVTAYTPFVGPAAELIPDWTHEVRFHEFITENKASYILPQICRAGKSSIHKEKPDLDELFAAPCEQAVEIVNFDFNGNIDYVVHDSILPPQPGRRDFESWLEAVLAPFTISDPEHYEVQHFERLSDLLNEQETSSTH